MKKYINDCNFEGFEDALKEIVNKGPKSIVKQFADASQQFFNLYPNINKWNLCNIAPLHIAVAQENLQLCQYIIT